MGLRGHLFSITFTLARSRRIDCSRLHSGFTSKLHEDRIRRKQKVDYTFSTYWMDISLCVRFLPCLGCAPLRYAGKRAPLRMADLSISNPVMFWRPKMVDHEQTAAF